MNRDKAFFEHVQYYLAVYLGQRLELQVDRHYTGVWVSNGPRLLSVGVNINPRYLKDVAKIDEELAMALRLDENAYVRTYRGSGGVMVLEVPKPQTLWKTLPLSELPQRRGLRAIVGCDGRKKPTDIDYSSPLTPHTMLAGATGSGKTNCLKLLTYNLVSQNEPDKVNFLLVDTRKRGANWKEFSRIPHLLHHVVTSEDEALKVLSWACAEIDRRAQTGQKTPHVFIGIDEAQDLLDKPEFVKVIGDIAAVGREFSIHLLAALQNPTSKQLGDTSIKRNLSCRLVGRVDSAVAAVVATGQEKTGAEKLTGAGDMLLIQPDSIRRLTAALLTTRDIETLPRSETTRELDLSQYEDTDHVVDQADMARRQPDPVEPHMVAVALVHRGGINKLSKLLRCGNSKAQRVLGFADELRRDLGLIGYGVYPVSHPVSSRNIIVAGKFATD